METLPNELLWHIAQQDMDMRALHELRRTNQQWRNAIANIKLTSPAAFTVDLGVEGAIKHWNRIIRRYDCFDDFNDANGIEEWPVVRFIVDQRDEAQRKFLRQRPRVPIHHLTVSGETLKINPRYNVLDLDIIMLVVPPVYPIPPVVNVSLTNCVMHPRFIQGIASNVEKVISLNECALQTGDGGAPCFGSLQLTRHGDEWHANVDNFMFERGPLLHPVLSMCTVIQTRGAVAQVRLTPLPLLRTIYATNCDLDLLGVWPHLQQVTAVESSVSMPPNSAWGQDSSATEARPFGRTVFTHCTFTIKV